LVVNVDAILIYEIKDTPTGLAIEALRTYWPLAQMTLQVLKSGLLGVKSMAPLSVNIVKHLGALGTVNYAGGYFGVGSTGESLLKEIIAAVGAKRWAVFSELLDGCPVDVQRAGQVNSMAAWFVLMAMR